MALDLNVDAFEEEAKMLDQIRPYYENATLEDRVAPQLVEFSSTCFPQTEKGAKKRSGKANKAGAKENEEAEEGGKYPKKRGRAPKVAVAKTSDDDEEEEMPKKRGRKKKI